MKKLADRNGLTLCADIRGNEKADPNTSSTPYIGPEQGVGVTKYLIRNEISKWSIRNIKSSEKIYPVTDKGKTFIKGPSEKNIEELLEKNKN